MTALTTLSAELAALMGDVVDVDGVPFPGLVWALGRRELSAPASPPRVVWVPIAATVEPPQKHDFPGRARSVLTRALSLEVHVWGVDVDQADAVLAGVIAAAHRRWSGRWAYLGERWQSDPAVTDLGEEIVATIAFECAVLDRAKTFTTPTSATFDTTDAAAGDGVLHLGE